MDISQLLTFLAQHPKHAWSPREIAARLKIPATERKELRNRLQRLSLEGKISRQRGGRYGSLSASPTVSGTLKVQFEGYGFVIPDDSSQADVFIPPKNMNFALPGDQVLASYFEKKEGNRFEGRILQILNRGRTHWIGRLEKRGKGFSVINEEKKVALEIYVPTKDLKGGRIGQTVVVKITRFPSAGGPMMGEIAEVLGEPADEKTETAAILVKHDIRRSFPPKVHAEVNRHPESVSDELLERRIDLRDLPIITIDGITARDFDDAVSVEKKGNFYHLTVSIADVAHFVPSAGATDEEALARGTSVYFPDFAVPMLPERLSNGLCSLKPDCDRLTLTCEMRFDESGRMTDAWYYESVIRSRKRGIYDEIQNFFDSAPFAGESYPAPVRVGLLTMKKLAELLMDERVRRGSIDFDLPEAEIIYNKEGEITAITKAKRFFSHRLIEEFMIAANVAVAELFSRLNIPILYRVHDEPEQGHITEFQLFLRNLGIKPPGGKPPGGKPAVSHLRHPKDFAHLLETLKTNPMEPLVHQVLLRSMKLAIYDPDNRGHFGLSLKNYCHFTSPIRRYPDLVVHRQLKYLLHSTKTGVLHLPLHPQGETEHHRKADTIVVRGGQVVYGPTKTFYSYRDVKYFGEISSKRERQAMEAEREMIRLKRALFMQNHVGDKFCGVIRRVVKFGLFVELEPYYIEGLLNVSDLTDDYYQFDDKRLRFVGRGKKRKIYQTGDKIQVRVKDVSIENRQVSLEMG